MLVDSHCHLQNNEELENIIARATNAQVEYILDVGDNLSNLPEHIEITKRFSCVYTSAGAHPHEAQEYINLKAIDILHALEHDKVIAIGEAGLDYFYDYSPKEVQMALFKEHIIAAQTSGLPLIIHNRQSDDDMIDILRRAYDKKEFKGIIHCYSSSKELGQTALDMGFYISASGMITFPRSEDIRNNFTKIPLDRILVETDSPYLAPVPKRGQVNEPANVVLTAQKMAEIKNVSFDEICEVTTNNFKRLFGL
jgi:TatD DNase family protein